MYSEVVKFLQWIYFKSIWRAFRDNCLETFPLCYYSLFRRRSCEWELTLLFLFRIKSDFLLFLGVLQSSGLAEPELTSMIFAIIFRLKETVLTDFFYGKSDGTIKEQRTSRPIWCNSWEKKLWGVIDCTYLYLFVLSEQET